MDDIQRGKEADLLLKNPVLKDAFTMLERYYTDQMVKTKINEVEERNEWHACVNVLNDVKTSLEALIQNGEIEQDKAEKAAAEKEKKNARK